MIQKKLFYRSEGLPRNRFNGITIGITGSSGKTSTNYLLSSSLKEFGKAHKTFENNNNMVDFR